MNIRLVLLKNNGSHKAFPLTSGVTVIGRRHDCDLYAPLPTVSRRHCQINQNGSSLEIRDLKSTCGTFVNNKKVDGETPLKAGDYIRVGPLVFLCQVDGKPEKITPPPKPAKPAVKSAAKPAPKPAAKGEESADSFGDLDASDSFVDLDKIDNLDESDVDLEDLKDL
jgi:predicted component of type VI protein secretion system